MRSRSRDGWLQRAARKRRFSLRATGALLALLGLGVISARARPGTLPGSGLENLSGQPVNPFTGRPPAATVFIFISTTCPLSQRYSPEIQRLEAKFSPRGAVFYLVYPDPSDTPQLIYKFLKAYGYSTSFQILRDPKDILVKRTGVRVTPEVAVFAGERRQMVYRGRIDNWYVRLGLARRAATIHDLSAALSAILAGTPVIPRFTPAIGCFISDMQ